MNILPAASPVSLPQERIAMSNKLRGKGLLLVGFTLFSMFFGAGNLIFPPII